MIQSFHYACKWIYGKKAGPGKYNKTCFLHIVGIYRELSGVKKPSVCIYYFYFLILTPQLENIEECDTATLY